MLPNSDGFWWRCVKDAKPELTEVRDGKWRPARTRRRFEWLAEENDVRWMAVAEPKTDWSRILVRLPKQLHEELKAEATEQKTSLNQLCVAKLNT